jgi:hypothetical protein
LFRDKDGVYGELKPDDGKPEENKHLKKISSNTSQCDFMGKQAKLSHLLHTDNSSTDWKVLHVQVFYTKQNLGFQIGENVDSGLLGYDAMQSGR